MINWIKNRLFRKETPDEVAESFSPVGVRVNPAKTVKLKPADTNVSGYNVHETEIGAEDDHSATVNDLKTTGVDPYNTGYTDVSDAKKPVPDK